MSFKKNNKAIEPLRTAPRKNYLTISSRCHFCFPHNKRDCLQWEGNAKNSVPPQHPRSVSAISNLTVSFLDNLKASPHLRDHSTLTELQLTVLEAFPVSFCWEFWYFVLSSYPPFSIDSFTMACYILNKLSHSNQIYGYKTEKKQWLKAGGGHTKAS